MAKNDDDQIVDETFVDEPVTEELKTPTYDPTPLPEEPVAWDVFTVFVTVEGGDKKSIYDWWGDNRIVDVVLVSNEDESITFDFDDNGGGPAYVIVYTNGRS